MAESEFIMDHSDNEEFIHSHLRNNKKKSLLLFLLSFVISQKKYGSIFKVVAPVLKNVKLPTPAEFKTASNSRPHAHHTPLSAVLCLHKDCLPQTTRASLSTFIQAYAISNIVDLLVNLSRKRMSLKQIIYSIQFYSSARFALSISSYVLAYKSLARFFTRLFDPLFRPPSSVSMINDILCSPLAPPFFAGLLAGPTLLIDNDQSRRIFISVYMLSKSLQFTYHALRQNGIIPRMPWWWGSWLLFPISSAQLIYVYLLHPDVFPSGYDKFITSRSTTYVNPRPSDFPDTMPWPNGRETINCISTLSLLYFPEFYSPKLHGRDVPPLPNNLKSIRPILEIAHPAHSKMMCAMLHHEEPSCFVTYTKFIAKEGLNTLKFMGLIYTSTLILRTLRGGSSIQSRSDIIIQIFNNVIPEAFKGATFITMAIATSWALICGFQNILPNKFMPISRIYLNGFIGGLWILVENPSRRLDIGMYSMRLLIETSWKLLVKKGRVRNIRNGEAIYFSLAMAIIMSIHKTQPRSITSSYVRTALSRMLED